MDVSTALREARERRGLTQHQLGRRVGYGGNMISAIECGERRLAHDVAIATARLLDDPDLYMALAEEATGAVMVPIVLDGPRVDLHRLATGRKLAEEAAEAIEALAKCDALTNCRSGPDLDEAGRRQVAEVVHQVAELVTCAANTLRVMCLTYGFSPTRVCQDHVAELVAKGYAARRREASKRASAA